MKLLRFIFTSLISGIGNLFHRKNNLLEWHLVYGPSPLASIKMRHKEEGVPDDLLIASYILFLARYFYICDDRQVVVVRGCLLHTVRDMQVPHEVAGKLYEAALSTLNSSERDAVGKLFFMGIPPVIASEEEEPGGIFAKYSFVVFENRGQLTSSFHISAGPDIVLLPLTVGILYGYVVHKMRDKSKRATLDRAVIDLLQAHASVDCRSLAGLHELPVEIVGRNELRFFSDQPQLDSPCNASGKHRGSANACQTLLTTVWDRLLGIFLKEKVYLGAFCRLIARSLIRVDPYDLAATDPGGRLTEDERARFSTSLQRFRLLVPPMLLLFERSFQGKLQLTSRKMRRSYGNATQEEIDEYAATLGEEVMRTWVVAVALAYQDCGYRDSEINETVAILAKEVEELCALLERVPDDDIRRHGMLFYVCTHWTEMVFPRGDMLNELDRLRNFYVFNMAAQVGKRVKVFLEGVYRTCHVIIEEDTGEAEQA